MYARYALPASLCKDKYTDLQKLRTTRIYTVFSLWDTYRAAHSLYTILQTERVDDFVNTMLAIYDEQGYLPIWHLHGYETKTMVGISSLQVIAEAYLKYDVNAVSVLTDKNFFQGDIKYLREK